MCFNDSNRLPWRLSAAGTQNERRGRLAEHGKPVELSAAETSAQLTAAAARATRVIWVGWNITAANARAIIGQSHALPMATYGEFIAIPYSAGIADGADAPCREEESKQFFF